jgi:hypothetical protein
MASTCRKIGTRDFCDPLHSCISSSTTFSRIHRHANGLPIRRRTMAIPRDPLPERVCIAACRRIAAQSDPCGEGTKAIQSRTFKHHGRLGRVGKMENREFAPVGFIDLRALLDDAWTDFKATSPVGIDLIAEASVRSLIANRLMRAAEKGETDRSVLKAVALNGL